jgi:hypothetical protein
MFESIIPGVLLWCAYLASMPALFIAWAALEIKMHPNKYR